MNKITINEDIITEVNSDLTYEYITDSLIKKLNIKVLKTTFLNLNINSNIKLDIVVDIDENVRFDLLEIKKLDTAKIHIKYNLNKNSFLNVCKLHDVDNIFERNIVNLKGLNSELKYVLKTVTTTLEKYDISINHKYKNTVSKVITNGINISGNLEFNVSSSVLKECKNSNILQKNRIINLNEKPSLIRPIMLIDEFDCQANHSALIGNFSLEEYFYFQRLGIDKDTALKLFLEGFIKSNCSYEKQVIDMYQMYWR